MLIRWHKVKIDFEKRVGFKAHSLWASDITSIKWIFFFIFRSIYIGNMCELKVAAWDVMCKRSHDDLHTPKMTMTRVVSNVHTVVDNIVLVSECIRPSTTTSTYIYVIPNRHRVMVWQWFMTVVMVSGTLNNNCRSAPTPMTTIIIRTNLPRRL